MTDSGAERAARRIAKVAIALFTGPAPDDGGRTVRLWIDKMAAIIQEETGTQWISVSERLPEMVEIYPGSPKRLRVLAFTGKYVCEAEYGETYKKRTPRWTNANLRGISVTHWMPLPPAPEEEGTR